MQKLVLGDLVAQDDLGLELLSGGADALAREVAGAHSIDVAEPTRFLEPRWIMLTAGLRLKGSASAQRALIRELDEGGMSALGIGVDLVFKRVPAALLEEARARAFPVLAVPLGTAFRDIVGFVNRSLLSSDLRTYQRLNAIQLHLVDALREPRPREAMVERLARMLDAGVIVLGADGRVELSSGPVPELDVAGRIGEREFEHDGWHVVGVPIGDAGWIAVTSRGRVLSVRLARPAAQVAVPLLAATERLDDVARDQERAVRAALLDEALEGGDERSLAARAAVFGLDFAAPARVVVAGEAGPRGLAAILAGADVPHLVSARAGRDVALVQGELPELGALRAGSGRAISAIGDVPRSLRDAELAFARAEERQLAYEDLDLATLLLSEVDAGHIRPRVDALLAPLRANPPLLEALVEYFARDMDVNAAADAMHVHPNTLRYRLGRVEKLLGRSLREPATIAELSLALLAD